MTVSIQTRQFLSKTQRYRELLRVFIESNLSTRYRGSFLGVFWSLLHPIIMTALYTALFSGVFSHAFDSVLDYAFAAFVGLLIINFFSASTNQALVSIVANGPLLNKIHVPMSVFPVAANLANVFQFAVAPLPLLIIVTLIKSKSLLNVLALLLPFSALVLFCLGVGFLISTTYVFFRDLPYFYELVIFVLWMSSPVFYPSKIIPPQVKPFVDLNPLVSIIESTRQIALSGEFPDLSLISGSLLGGMIIFGLGWSFFQRLKPQFMDLL